MASESIMEYIEDKENRGINPQALGVNSWDEAAQVLQRIGQGQMDSRYQTLARDYMSYERQQNREAVNSQPKPRPQSQPQTGIGVSGMDVQGMDFHSDI